MGDILLWPEPCLHAEVLTAPIVSRDGIARKFRGPFRVNPHRATVCCQHFINMLYSSPTQEVSSLAWLIGVAILIVFTTSHIIMARRWRSRLQERVVPMFWHWNAVEDAHDPPEIMSRKRLLRLGPLGAAQVAILGGLLAGLFHALWVNALTAAVEGYILWELSWTLHRTARQRPSPNPDNAPDPS